LLGEVFISLAVMGWQVASPAAVRTAMARHYERIDTAQAEGRDSCHCASRSPQQQVQALLIERWGLVPKAEKRELPVYSLVVAKCGHKLTKSREQKGRNMSNCARRISGTTVNMKWWRMPWPDCCGVQWWMRRESRGFYDFSKESTPETATDENGRSIFTAIQDQIGLHRESKRAMAPVFLIQKINKPSEN